MVTLVPKIMELLQASAAPSVQSLLKQQLNLPVLRYCGRCTVSHASTATTAVGSSRLQVVL